MSITIPLETHVELGAKKPLRKAEDLQKAWCNVGGGLLEAAQPLHPNAIQVLSSKNLLVEAVHMAFFEHLPLVLSPDVIWVTILQGLANHIAMDPEGLRKCFVQHEGKAKIEVARLSLLKGSGTLNEWESALDDIVAEIGKHIGLDKADTLGGDFTTTGPAERAVAAVALMDSMQHYFEYSMLCGCGFPSITLTGTVEDWKRIRTKAGTLKQYKLDWWLDVLLPVLDQFVMAAEGSADTNFWRSLCNRFGLSGWYDTPVSGWIQAFFPYLNECGCNEFEEARGPTGKLRKNDMMAAYQLSHCNGINVVNYWGGGQTNAFDEPDNAQLCGNRGVPLKDFPPAVSSAPFTFIDLSVVPEAKYHMKLLGGVSCIVQHPSTRAVEPKLTWAVVELGPADKE